MYVGLLLTIGAGACQLAGATTINIYRDFGGQATPRTFVYDAMYIFPDMAGDLLSADLTATKRDCLHTIGDNALGAQN